MAHVIKSLFVERCASACFQMLTLLGPEMRRIYGGGAMPRMDVILSTPSSSKDHEVLRLWRGAVEKQAGSLYSEIEQSGAHRRYRAVRASEDAVTGVMRPHWEAVTPAQCQRLVHHVKMFAADRVSALLAVSDVQGAQMYREIQQAACLVGAPLIHEAFSRLIDWPNDGRPQPYPGRAPDPGDVVYAGGAMWVMQRRAHVAAVRGAPDHARGMFVAHTHPPA
jgi:hypothetical protein